MLDYQGVHVELSYYPQLMGEEEDEERNTN